MRRTDRKLTNVEIIHAFETVIDIILNNSKGAVMECFRKESRSAQIGYLIQRFFVDEKILEPGEENEQLKIESGEET